MLKKVLSGMYITIRARKLLLQVFKARKAYKENWRDERVGRVRPREQADCLIQQSVRTSLTVRGRGQTWKQMVQERPVLQLG